MLAVLLRAGDAESNDSLPSPPPPPPTPPTLDAAASLLLGLGGTSEANGANLLINLHSAVAFDLNQPNLFQYNDWRPNDKVYRLQSRVAVWLHLLSPMHDKPVTCKLVRDEEDQSETTVLHWHIAATVTEKGLRIRIPPFTRYLRILKWGRADTRLYRFELTVGGQDCYTKFFKIVPQLQPRHHSRIQFASAASWS